MHTYQEIEDLGKYDQDKTFDIANEVGYVSHKFNMNKFYYFNNENDKIFINFLDIEIVYNSCNQSLSFKLTLYKHLKSEGTCQDLFF